MNYIFFLLIGTSIVVGFFNGTLAEVEKTMLESCNNAVKIAFSLIGIMAFWLGIMRIAEKSGLINIVSKLIYPIMKPLFRDIPKDSPALADITMSISANALGLSNAATPIGLKVMKELQENNPNKDVATDEMCMFLLLNISSLQLIPMNMIAYRSQYGSVNPTMVVGPAFIATFITTFATLVICKMILRYGSYKKKGS